jgi:hypothetical protein
MLRNKMRRTCYICREKGRLSSSCTKGTPHPTLFNLYSVRLAMCLTNMLVLKVVSREYPFGLPSLFIMTNFLGLRLVVDQQVITWKIGDVDGIVDVAISLRIKGFFYHLSMLKPSHLDYDAFGLSCFYHISLLHLALTCAHLIYT